MNKKIRLCCVVVFVFASSVKAQVKLSNTDLIKLDFKVLAVKKARVKAKDPALMPAYKQLLIDGDNLLNYAPVSVMDKKDLPPSGDKHDYMSIAPYWWPNPAKPNGLPYIRKDGEVNPEVRDYTDKENMPKLCENVYRLALAYYFSDNEKYAKHAAKLLKVWFLDSATKMNPNLKYGQAVKGVNEGRAEGIIDTRQFIFAIDGITLLQRSTAWSKQNNAAMQNWFSQFLTWLNTSKIGVEERNAGNNHGVWFDAQALCLALFVKDSSLSNQIVKRAVDRLDVQMDNDGFFPKELERTTSLHYSVFIMNAFNIIGNLSDKTNNNFWTITTPSGKSYQKAFDCILPFLTKEKTWTGKQIKEFHMADAYPFLLQATTSLGCKKCHDAIVNSVSEKREIAKMIFNLL